MSLTTNHPEDEEVWVFLSLHWDVLGWRESLNLRVVEITSVRIMMSSVPPTT
jgi:hypothetical protein